MSRRVDGIDLTIVSTGSEEDVNRALAGKPANREDGSESGDDSGTSKKAAAGKSDKGDGDRKNNNQPSKDEDDSQDDDQQDDDQDGKDGQDATEDDQDDDNSDENEDDQDDQDDQDDDEPKAKTKGKKGIQRRINKLVGRLNQASQELANERRLRQEAEARAAKKDSRGDDDDAKGSGKDSKSAKPVDVGPKPKVKDFGTYDEYLEAKAEWDDKRHEATIAQIRADAEAKAQAKIDKLLADQEGERTKREKAEAQRLYEERQEAARAKYDDFDEVMQTTDVQVSQAVMHYVTNHKHGQDLAYHLAHPDNEKEAKRLFRLPVDDQILRVAELLKGFAEADKPKNKKPVAKARSGEGVDSGKGGGNNNAKPLARKSNAPPPPQAKRSGGKPSSGVKDADYYSNLSYEDYKKERSKGGSLYGGRD